MLQVQWVRCNGLKIKVTLPGDGCELLINAELFDCAYGCGVALYDIVPQLRAPAS